MASNNRADLLKKVTANLGSAVKDREANNPEPVVTRKPSSVISRRAQAVDSIRHQNKVPTVQYRHPTARIRMWSGHNREYETLNPTNCADLIDGFQRAGGQQIPAIARKVTDNEDFDLEVICGARRHWTAAFLEEDLLVEIRDIDDRTAFILQDLENRDRMDVSDLERAIDYKNALPLYFKGDQIAMGNYLKIDKGNFSRLMYLAEFPVEIIEAYGDKRDIKVHHGTVYKQMLNDPKSRKVLMERAASLKGKHVPGKDVFAMLKKPISEPKLLRKDSVGKASVTRKTKRKLQINLDLSADISQKELSQLQQDCSKLITQVLKIEEPA